MGFRWKRHNNKILKVQILLSRNFVVIAQAPKIGDDQKSEEVKKAGVLSFIRFHELRVTMSPQCRPKAQARFAFRGA